MRMLIASFFSHHGNFLQVPVAPPDIANTWQRIAVGSRASPVLCKPDNAKFSSEITQQLFMLQQVQIRSRQFEDFRVPSSYTFCGTRFLLRDTHSASYFSHVIMPTPAYYFIFFSFQQSVYSRHSNMQSETHSEAARTHSKSVFGHQYYSMYTVHSYYYCRMALEKDC